MTNMPNKGIGKMSANRFETETKQNLYFFLITINRCLSDGYLILSIIVNTIRLVVLLRTSALIWAHHLTSRLTALSGRLTRYGRRRGLSVIVVVRMVFHLGTHNKSRWTGYRVLNYFTVRQVVVLHPKEWIS